MYNLIQSLFIRNIHKKLSQNGEDGLKCDGGSVGFNEYFPINNKLNNIYILLRVVIKKCLWVGKK
jgi:hypothetical protein